MKKLVAMVAFIVAGACAPVLAATRTVTLSVPGMDCATCPITIRKALQRIDGVSKVIASLETREATVTFDDSKATIEALRKATADAGYPSEVKK